MLTVFAIISNLQKFEECVCVKLSDILSTSSFETTLNMKFTKH